MKTYIQEKLRGTQGQVVTFKTIDSKLEAVVQDLVVDPTKSIILTVNAPDSESRVVVTNGVTTLESNPDYLEFVPEDSDGLVTSNDNDYYTTGGNVRVFSLPTLGTWVVAATKGGISTQSSIDIPSVGSYEITLSYFKAYIDVTFPLGSICTCTNGIVTIESPETDGTYRFCVNSIGDWTVQALSEDAAGQAIEIVHISTVDEIIDVTLDYVEQVLNENSWQIIQSITAKGLASSYWSLGDCKVISLSGTIGGVTYDPYEICVEIVGFDHNTEIESNSKSTITFQIGKRGVNDYTRGSNNGKEVGLYFPNSFYMNPTNTSVGGWQNSYMRTHTMIEVRNALPADLVACLMSVKKYTDNSTTSTHNASVVTYTYDTVFLPSAYEVFTSPSSVNSSEATYQEQYAYYNVHPNLIRYRNTATTTANAWWLRSPGTSNSTTFSCVNTSGASATASASTTSYMLAPMFVVGR